MNQSIRNIILAKDICSVISFLDNTFLCLKVYPSTFFVERLTRVLYIDLFSKICILVSVLSTVTSHSMYGCC